MPQLFPPFSNLLARCTVAGLIALGIASIGGGYLLQAGPYYTYQDQVIEQPVPFSHQHHVGGLGIDCRNCHTSVEEGRYAGMPPTSTCMSCHSQLWTNADALQPVRDSWETNEPIAWNRVHDLPDYAYFDHSIHIAKGVGCNTCHGRIDEMPLVRKDQPLTMGWCLDCHRNPSEHQRPQDKIYDLHYQPPGGEKGRELSKSYGTLDRVAQLQNCSTCHR